MANFDDLLAQREQAIAANPVATPQTSGFDEALRKREESLGQLRFNAGQAVQTPANKLAQQKALSQITGLPLSVVQTDEGDAQARAKFIEIQEATKTSPILRHRMMSGDFMTVAQNDVPLLKSMEEGVGSALKYFMGNGPGDGFIGTLRASPYRAAEALTGVKRAIADVLGSAETGNDGYFGKLSQAYGQQAREFKESGDRANPPATGIIQGGLDAGVNSFVQSGKYLPLALAGGPVGAAAALGGMALETFGPSYNKASEKNLPLWQRLTYGASDAVIEYGTERGPLAAMVGGIKAGAPMFKTLLKTAWQENKGEQVATVLQDLNEWATINPDRPFSEYLADRPAAAAQTAIAVLVGSGGNVALSEGLQRAADRANGFDRQAQYAVRMNETLLNLQKTMSATEMLKHSSGDLQSYAQSLFEEGAPKVYIDPAKLVESGVNMQELAQAFPAIADQLPNLEVGHDIVLDTSDLLVNTLGAAYAQPLIDNLRTDPNGMSKVEAEEYMKTKGDDLNKEIERVMQEKEQDTEFKASRDKIQEEMLAKLTAANRFTAPVNKQYAALAANFYAVMSARAGMRLEDFANKYKLGVNAEITTDKDGFTFDQSGRLQTETPAFKNFFGDSKVVDAEGKPLVVYHGTGASFDTFNKDKGATGAITGNPIAKYGFFFSDAPGVSDGYAENAGDGANVMPVYLSLKKPYEMDMWRDFAPLSDKRGIVQDDKVKPFIESLKKQGYDGIILKGGSTYREFMAFDPTQIKSAIGNNGNFDPSNPNILEQGTLAGTFYQGNPADLVAQHNLTAENLLHAVKMGGIPVPSLAVTNKAHPLTNFGEITLLAPSEMVDPKGYAATKVFGADIYSPRYPKISYNLDTPALKKLNEFLKPYRTEGMREVYSGQITSADDLTSHKAFKAYADPDGSARWGELLAKANALLEQSGAKERIFQGFTYSGNRRYTPHTLENVVKILKKELRGGENFNYGVGSLRAKFTPQFKSLEQIRKAKGRLMDKSAFEAVKKEVDDELVGISEDLGLSLDQTIEVLEDTPKMGAGRAIERALKDYKRDDSPASDETKVRVAEFLTRLRNLPTEYFEAKILRDVSLSEFKGAVVPEGVDPKVIEALNARGVTDIRTYKKGDDADRAAKIGEFGNLFFQQARGQIQFANDITQQESLITLFKDADLSTFIHEGGHFFLEVQADLASKIAAEIAKGATVTDGEQSILDDFNTTLKWFGLEGTEELSPIDQWASLTREEKRPYHEQWARGFEAYAFEGKAPSIELTSMFQNFRSWLVNVYRTIKMSLIGDVLDVKLNDEVRAVMDRMLATSEAIAEAEAARNLGPLFKTPEEAGMDMEAYTAYHEMGMQGTKDAIDELQAKGLKDLQWLRNARSRVLKQLQKQHDALRREIELEVRKEVMADPVYQVWQYLTGKKVKSDVTVDSETDETFATGKLDTDLLRKTYGTEPTAIWRILSERRMTSTDGGISSDALAEMKGFPSGDEMVKALAAAVPPQQLIDSKVDQRMLQENGELATPEAIERAADIAIHNDARVKFVATEMRALQHAMQIKDPATGKSTVDVLVRAAKEHASKLISGMTLREIRPHQYASAEARAARAAQKAVGDTEKQLEAKRNQLVNMYAAKAGYAAQEEVRSAVEYFKKVSKGSPKIDPTYFAQIEALLEDVELKPRSEKSRDTLQSLRDWYDGQIEEGMEPEIPKDLLDASRRTNFKDMTIEQIRGLRDTIKQIEHLGRMKSKLLTAKDQKEFQQAVTEIVESIEANRNGREPKDNFTDNAALAASKYSLQGFWAAHIKSATWARVMDGGKDGGKVWDYLIRTANEAGNQEVVMKEKATKAIMKIMKPVMDEMDLFDKGITFPTIGRTLNKEARIAMALNVGNAGNLQRMLDGSGWTMAQIQPVLDTLTEADWNAVQQIWDHFESYRPMIAAKEMRVYGKEPDWIEPVPFRTKFGLLRGGYYPVKYDLRANMESAQHETAATAQAALKAAYTSATTKRSFTKTRAEKVVGRPVLLNMDGVYSGLNEVIHDLTHHEWLIDANKLMRATQSTMLDYYGPEAVKNLKDWIADIAEGGRGAHGAGERASAWLRQGVSVAGIGWNVMSALTQPLGIVNSIVRVGPKWVGKGISQYMGSPLKSVDMVNEKSEFMRTRALTRLRELAEVSAKMRGRTKLREAIDSSAYYMMMRMQQVVDVPTWLGAYEKAISEGANEDKAIGMSDQAVIDAQASGSTKDLSAIERGSPTSKLFTVFYSYFNATLNLGVGQAMTSQNKAKLAAEFLLMYTVPVILLSAMKQAIQPSGDDDEWDDPEKMFKALAGEQISFLFGMFVGIRELAPAFQALTGTNTFPTDYKGPAGVRTLVDATKLAEQLGQGEMDTALRKAIVNMTGDLLRLPSGQVNKTWTGIEALANGDTDNPAAILLGYKP